MANIFHVERAANKITLGTTGTTINIAPRTASQSLALDASKNLVSVDLGTVYQPLDAGLTSLAGLTYASDSFIKVTATDTYAIRTLAEVKTDLSLNLVENTAHSTDAHTMTIDGRDVSVDGSKLDGIEALADVTASNETSHADVVVDGDFASNGILNRTGIGAYSILALGTDVQAYHANLAAIAAGTWAGASSITTLGTIATVGNITIANGGTIGQAAGPLLTFDDTNNYLGITGCNVGIGTLIPAYKLGIVEDDAEAIFISSADSNNTSTLGFGISTSSGYIFIQSTKSGTGTIQPLTFLVGDTRRITIATDGKFGIGLTSPKTLLTIEGALTLKEQAAADGDTAAYGQIWVKTAIPNELWFTDDAGTDHQIAFV